MIVRVAMFTTLILTSLCYSKICIASSTNLQRNLASPSLLFDYEKLQVQYSTPPNVSGNDTRLFALGNSSEWDSNGRRSSRYAVGHCKVFPGGLKWPTAHQWQLLNQLSNGALLQPKPASHVCYNNTHAYSASACQTVTTNWSDLRWHTDDPLEMLSPFKEGNTCLPPTIYNSGTCDQGGYPVFVVNATNVRDIQLAVNFARNTGIRLVVKNTGHDFNGKSGGAGSLSIWLHNLKDQSLIETFESLSYTGPAIKAGAGVQVEELYAFAHQHGHVAVGGDCSTVGVVGGYIQGGGHSPLSPLFGMAADQALEFQVVLANGSFVAANEKDNADLFWALAGGGGGTFGIVTSVVVKVHPDIAVSTANWTLSTTSEGVSKDVFWQVVQTFMSHFPSWADDGLYTFFLLWSDFPSLGETTLDITPFLAPNRSLDQLRTSLAPWVAELKRFNISALPIFDHYADFYSTWLITHRDTMQVPNQIVSSRLWPRNNFEDNTLFDTTFRTIRNHSAAGYSTFGYNIAPTLSRGGHPNNSVTPAWRDTVSHMMSGVTWPLYSTPAEIMQTWDKFEGYMDSWRKLSPDSGAYVNEADRIEPQWQKSFWGDHYPRLVQIKRLYDPDELFWAHHAVGSEAWDVKSVDGLPNENGRLCRI